MCPAIDNSASCKIHAVIHFLHAKNMSAEPYLSYQQSCKIGNQDGRLERNSLAVDVVLSCLL
jgi:hypothetical protein